MDLAGRLGRVAVGAIAFIGVATEAAPVRAHFILVAPDAWMSQNPFGDPQKVGPCGDEGGGTASGKVTTFRPGQTVEITVDEIIYHPGHYRVALAINDRSELPPPPPVTAVGSDPCGSTEIQATPTFPILADNVLPHARPFAEPQTFTVTLPTDITCTRCTLQVIEYMSNHSQPCFYYHCADISIQNDPATPTAPAGTTPTATSTLAVAGTSTPAPPASCAGDCSRDGRVAIDELVTLVNIATERAPLSRCPILPDPPRIDFLVQAVNSALRGCGGAGPTPTPVPPGFPCSADADCDTHQFCREPGGFLGCGVCIDPPVIDDNFTRCTTDDDCADSPDTPRCEPLGDATNTCPACEGEVSVCFQPACTMDDECEVFEMCEQHRCRGRQCLQDGECPTTHRCATGDVRRCQRRACTTSADCGDDFCVNRLCYLELGRCTLRPS